MASPSRTLLIEPFYGGSHKQLFDLITDKFSSCDTFTLPAKKWHWRARTSALYFAQVIPKKQDYCILFASSVLNLAELVALRPDLDSYKILYFHEHQLSYPVRKDQERDFQYGYNQILSCLVADQIFFNSDYCKESFLKSISTFLKLIPDHRPSGLEEQIRPKCDVLNFPIVFPDVQKISEMDRTADAKVNAETHRPAASVNVDDKLNRTTSVNDKDQEKLTTGVKVSESSSEEPVKMGNESSGSAACCGQEDIDYAGVRNLILKDHCDPTGRLNQTEDRQTLQTNAKPAEFAGALSLPAKHPGTSKISGTSNLIFNQIDGTQNTLTIHSDSKELISAGNGLATEQSESIGSCSSSEMIPTSVSSCTETVRTKDVGDGEGISSGDCVTGISVAELVPGLYQGKTSSSSMNLEKRRSPDNQGPGPLHIVWPHRWEHDKNPELFFTTLYKLADMGLDFRISVLGEQFSEWPVIFHEAHGRLSGYIEHWGYQPSKDDYYRVLIDADVVVSTADHEFFGVAMLEAVHCGCYPLCPNRLVYPEIFTKEYLYNTNQQLYKRLREFCRHPHLVRNHTVKVNTMIYSWDQLKRSYARYLTPQLLMQLLG